MSDLLQVTRFPIRREATPMFMTFPVNPDGAPFLVSSIESFVWVPEAPGGFVHAAVRTIGQDDGVIFREVLETVQKTGGESEWENVHPLTTEGIQAAINHVAYYGFEEIDLLVPEGMGPVEVPEDVECIEAPWLEGMAVAVPKDRSFVGVVGKLTSSRAIVLVHNPSRGIGIAVELG